MTPPSDQPAPPAAALSPLARVVVGTPDDADLCLADCDDASELAEQLAAALDGAVRVTIDFRVAAGTRVAVPDAARALRESLQALHHQPEVTVYVASERVVEVVSDLLAPRSSAVRRARFGALTVDVTEASITELDGDAVVNASNTNLRLGGGVSLALRLAAGPRLQPAMSALAPIGPHDLVETPAFDHTKTKAILHVPTASGDAEVIATAYRNVLRVARERGYGRVILPSLGTGTGQLDARVGAELLRQALEEGSTQALDGPPLTLSLALFAPRTADLFAEVLGAR